jgi:BirA family biotin operon repressor/biotin-[acetyl-CoA-carboxylase] ligase
MDTLFIGQHLIQLDTVHSTNTYAMELLRDTKLSEGTIIQADNQTNGRGQRGNSWKVQPSMNLTFSLILYPVFLSPENHFYLSKSAALATHDALAEIINSSQHDIKIKWPNDILINENKIAGILIENTFRNERIQYSVIGIGLNVNQIGFEGLSRKATSIKEILHVESDKMKILNSFCKTFEARYLEIRSGKFEKIDADYKSNMYLLDTWHNFKTDGKVIMAKIKDVDVKGNLITELKNGKNVGFEVKEIAF